MTHIGTKDEVVVLVQGEIRTIVKCASHTVGIDFVVVVCDYLSLAGQG